MKGCLWLGFGYENNEAGFYEQSSWLEVVKNAAWLLEEATGIFLFRLSFEFVGKKFSIKCRYVYMKLAR